MKITRGFFVALIVLLALPLSLFAQFQSEPVYSGVNIMDYHAANDSTGGAANNYAFSRAVAAAGVGGSVIIPAGQYLFDSTITISTSKLTIECSDGAWLYFPIEAQESYCRNGIAFDSVSYVTWSGGHIVGDADSLALVVNHPLRANGFYLTRCYAVKIVGVEVYGFEYGIRMAGNTNYAGGGQTLHSIVRDCKVHHNQRDNIILSNCSYNTIVGNQSYESGYLDYGPDTAYASWDKSSGDVGSGITIRQYDFGGNEDTCWCNTIKNNEVWNCRGQGIMLIKLDSLAPDMRHTKISNNTVHDIRNTGIMVASAPNTVVENNYVWDCNRPNNFAGNWCSPATFSRVGIQLETGSHKSIVRGNVIFDTQTYDTASPGGAIMYAGINAGDGSPKVDSVSESTAEPAPDSVVIIDNVVFNTKRYQKAVLDSSGGADYFTHRQIDGYVVNGIPPSDTLWRTDILMYRDGRDNIALDSFVLATAVVEGNKYIASPYYDIARFPIAGTPTADYVLKLAVSGNDTTLTWSTGGSGGTNADSLVHIPLQDTTGNISDNYVYVYNAAANRMDWEAQAGAGGGETNVLVAVGETVGDSLPSTKSGSELRIKSLIAGDNLTATVTDSTVEFDVAISSDLAMGTHNITGVGAITSSGAIHGGSHLQADGNIYINYDGSSQGGYLYFADEPGPNGAYLSYDTLSDCFILSAPLWVSQIDGNGATGLDYGSVDVTDHTFVTDGTGTAEIVLPAGSVDGTEILDQAIKGDDIDSTSENFVFSGAYKGTSAVEDSALMTKKYVDDHAGTGFNWADSAGEPPFWVDSAKYATDVSDDAITDVSNYGLSPMIITGGVVSAGTNAGTFKVSALTAYLRTTDSRTGDLEYVTLSEQDNETIAVANTTYFVSLNYNGGSPTITTVASDPYAADKRNIQIGKVMKDGSDDVHFISGGYRFQDGVEKLHKRAKMLRALELASGGTLAYTGTNQFTHEEAKSLGGLNSFTTAAYNSSVTNFTPVYSDGVGGWTYGTPTGTIDFAHYDDGDGTLGVVDNNKYSTFWVYVHIDDDDVYVRYGEVNDALAVAELECEPEKPTHLTDFGLLLGKIICPQSGGSFTSIQMVTEKFFTGTSVSDHGNLTGLEDDDHPQYLKESDTAAYATDIDGRHDNFTEFTEQTAFRVFYSNTSGDVTELALGADGTYLKSNGAAANPSFATPPGSGWNWADSAGEPPYWVDSAKYAELAVLASTVTIADNENTNETNAVVFLPNGDLNGGDLALESDGDFCYNPSTGRISVTGVNIGMLDALGATIGIGDDDETIIINSSDWDVSASGIVSGLGDVTSDGTINCDSLNATKYTDGSIDKPDLAVDVVDSTKVVTNSLSMSADMHAFTSASLLGKLSDETGSGLAVFGTNPTFADSGHFADDLSVGDDLYVGGDIDITGVITGSGSYTEITDSLITPTVRASARVIADSMSANHIVADVQMRANCDLHTEGNLHINKDSTAADAVVYFGDDDEVASIHFDDANDRFELSKKIHTADTLYYAFNLFDPDALYTGDHEILIPRKDQTEAITIVSIKVELDADPTTELEFSLKFADAFIGLANATVIDDSATVAGVATITGDFGDATVPANKVLYWLFDADPDDAITQAGVTIGYTVD